jgi:histidyl-tRNA synthetase
MKKVIQPVKGTRDFYPEQMAIRVWLYNTMRQVSESFGYQEYEAPILESLELYASRSGDELVKEQAFAFTDRGGSEITLRPELTLSLARMVAQKQNELNFPVRWWSFGPFWRYERPQKGRTREFFQWNVDMLGVSSPEADAENAAVLATFFQRVGPRSMSPPKSGLRFQRGSIDVKSCHRRPGWTMGRRSDCLLSRSPKSRKCWLTRTCGSSLRS